MKTALTVIGVIALLALIIFGSLGLQRLTQPFAAETNRLTESNTRNRVDGVNAGIVANCLNMRTATDPATKKAFATFVLTEADAFQRQDLLTPQARDCRAEAQGLTQ